MSEKQAIENSEEEVQEEAKKKSLTDRLDDIEGTMRKAKGIQRQVKRILRGLGIR